KLYAAGQAVGDAVAGAFTGGDYRAAGTAARRGGGGIAGLNPYGQQGAGPEPLPYYDVFVPTTRSMSATARPAHGSDGYDFTFDAPGPVTLDQGEWGPSLHLPDLDPFARLAAKEYAAAANAADAEAWRLREDIATQQVGIDRQEAFRRAALYKTQFERRVEMYGTRMAGLQDQLAAAEAVVGGAREMFSVVGGDGMRFSGSADGRLPVSGRGWDAARAALQLQNGPQGALGSPELPFPLDAYVAARLPFDAAMIGRGMLASIPRTAVLNADAVLFSQSNVKPTLSGLVDHMKGRGWRDRRCADA
ncbi:MAG TPA: hypothetical protein VK324_13710, partial [Tepidisphaeraceae bacterium]|nr:hypothetical protein [Tepidisphaeraceae bacterium]